MPSTSSRKYAFFAIATIGVASLLYVIAFQFNNKYQIELNRISGEPEFVVLLSKHLKKMPELCTRDQFEKRLSEIGMNSEPDDVKDNRYCWHLTSVSVDMASYILEADFRSDSQTDGPVLQNATINKVKTQGGPWQPIWRIVYW